MKITSGVAILRITTERAYPHKKGAFPHIRRIGIMIIFAAENDLTQMILCLTQTAQTYTEWLHRYCLQLSAAPSVLLVSRRNPQNSQNGCIECLRNKKKRLYVRNIFCATN